MLQALATRWIHDEPQPGLVEIEFTDADGVVHHRAEKSSVVDAEGRLGNHTRYPMSILIACQPRRHEFRSVEAGSVNVVDLSPWGMDDESVLYRMDRNHLMWSEPAVYSDLSVRARQAAALVTFHRWRRTIGFDCVDLVTLEDHLWEYLVIGPDTFRAWYESHPLTYLGSDEPLPEGIRAAADLCGVDQEGLRAAVNALIEITYGGLFGGIESSWSLTALETVCLFTARDGVAPASADDFADSLWVDNDWGNPEEESVRRWRALQ